MKAEAPNDLTPFELPPLNTRARVLLLPPTSRDGTAIATLLKSAEIDCAVFATMADLCAALDEGAGTVVVSEESVMDSVSLLEACVMAQPVWSDLPILVLSRSGAESSRLIAILEGLGNASVI